MDPQEITLLIKTPNQAQEDQTVEAVRLDWTVRDLKTHLSSVYPTEPAVSDQRLIFAGKLLPDHLHIKDLFRQTDSTPTLHLVCAFRTQPGGPLGARPKVRDTEPPPSSDPSAMPDHSPRTPDHSPRTPDHSPRIPDHSPRRPELRQRRPASSSSAATSAPLPSARPDAAPAAPQVTPPAFPTFALYSPQQLLWLQHVYARQYYMQYQAALAAAAGSAPSTVPAATIAQYPPVVVPAHQVPVAAPLANQNAMDNLPANQNPAAEGAAAFIDPAAANQNLRMNAQGGPVMEDEEEVERDWLDWLYSAARLGVLLMIVYFNSNLSRFLLVMSTLLLMYLHTAGWFPFRRRVQVQQQQPEVQQDQNQNQNQNQNQDQDANPQLDPAGDELDGQPGDGLEGGPGPMAAVLVPPLSMSPMWTAWVFFKTFFSSLIPDLPQDVAN